ncbi:uncharacterized protein TM35_000024140 [Trypanosoma theileri]|uniref:Uncharacterized protein n=1 Tax=Trypanosoma theileri TaxID=67003 RepID=A0A1X0P886_9TRYP|nr:uncharacterized protein TM35_000024140 [Trypanosoma theileri]ORC93088.1 hypothetical protein TM35_000024140 [Trypanosoma theileri]
MQQEKKERGPSPFSSSPEAAISFYFQQKDDELLCAFGPDFFDGARKGAAGGGLFTAWLTRRTFIDIKEDYREYEVTLPQHMRDKCWTLTRGFRTRPFFTLGCVSLALTTLMKSIKFSLANYRYQEFVEDDIGFELLQKMYSNTPGGDEDFKKFLNESLKNQNSPVTSIINDVANTPSVVTTSTSASGVLNSKKTTLTDALIEDATISREQKPPSFWDGVAVGLMGSVMDCYLPSKPIYSYYGMRCGMRI